MRQMAEASEEESKEQRQEVLWLSQVIDSKLKTIQELEEFLDQQETQWSQELETLKMKMEGQVGSLGL